MVNIMKKINIALIGVTGLVGRTILSILEESDVSINDIKFFASNKSIGKIVRFRNEEYMIQELNEKEFDDIDYALLSVPSSISSIWAPILEKKGIVVIDNSSFFRMRDDVALVVPELNINSVEGKRKIIACPNCSTIQSVLVLKPLDDAYRIKKINYITYQSVSGVGNKGIEELENVRMGRKPSIFPYDISKTCIPEIDSPLRNGYSKEEMKMIEESKKILGRENILISATCVRVPLVRSHAVVIHVEFEKKIDLKEIRDILSHSKGIILKDDFLNHIYPLSSDALNNDLVYVGRVRKDIACENGIILYVVGDNIRRGAAYNVVETLKGLLKN